MKGDRGSPANSKPINRPPVCPTDPAGPRKPLRGAEGTRIHRCRDSEGLIEVIDHWGVRSLHFGTSTRQSAMALDAPDRLEFAYCRAMLIGLLLIPAPQRVLLIGLGGGSLAKFLLRHLPNSQVVAVEPREALIEIARRFFGVPIDERLQVHVDGGLEFLEQGDDRNDAYDWILVDAYDGQGLAPSLKEDRFYAALARRLKRRGVVTMNLWNHPLSEYRTTRQGLARHLPQCPLRLTLPGGQNLIGIGLQDLCFNPRAETFRSRARSMEADTGIEFPRFLQRLGPL